MVKHTVDRYSSPDRNFKPRGLLESPYLWVTYNAANDRTRRDGKEEQPLEWEAVAFWEDMYHHVLLKGYSNNSQIPSNNQQEDRCDLVTRWYNPEKRTRETFLFTEVKRANKHTESNGIENLEKQVLGYCRHFVTASGDEEVFACTTIGTRIRCMIAKGIPAKMALYDLSNLDDQINPSKSSLDNYLDPGKSEDAKKIRKHFAKITEGKTPPFPYPFSRPSSRIGSSPPAPPAPTTSPSNSQPPSAPVSQTRPDSSPGSLPPHPPAHSTSRSASQSPSARGQRTPSPQGSETQNRDQVMSGISPQQMAIRRRHDQSPSNQTGRSDSPRSTPPRNDRDRSPLPKRSDP